MNDLEDEREIMMYLRHEAGHAFTMRTGSTRPRSGASSSALFAGRTARTTAGSVLEELRPAHRRWYAQKHPDEDFAETFAVWLTPRSTGARSTATGPAR